MMFIYYRLTKLQLGISLYSLHKELLAFSQERNLKLKG